MKLLLNSTPLALWHDIIHEAENTCAISLKEELESYLVFLLMRYTNKPEAIRRVVAADFLEGLSFNPKQRALALQTVGDNCLIFSGLFPKIAQKRLVKISYFVKMGQSAYIAISREKD